MTITVIILKVRSVVTISMMMYHSHSLKALVTGAAPVFMKIYQALPKSMKSLTIIPIKIPAVARIIMRIHHALIMEGTAFMPVKIRPVVPVIRMNHALRDPIAGFANINSH